MPIRHKEVIVAIVVIIKKSRPPTEIGNTLFAERCRKTGIGEETTAIIAIERVVVVRKIGYKEIEVAVVVVSLLAKPIPPCSRPSSL